MIINVCPACKNALLLDFKDSSKIYCTNNKCSYSKNPFESINGTPILIPFEKEYCILQNDLKNKSENKNFGSKKRTNKKYQLLRTQTLKHLKRLFIGENKFSNENYQYLKKNLLKEQKVLVIGGGTQGDGSKSFYDRCKNLNISLEIIDIYKSNECTIIADAHYLPYKDKCFDFVIIQAVLEHVAFPYIVVDEIKRVLKNGGIVYSEMPFMQNVHEGPYDFTRYSHSGHRLLFREFDEIKSGVHQGAFSSLLFISSNTISSFTRIKFLGPILRLLFSRISRFMDSLMDNKDNVDIACGTFLICSKRNSKNEKVNNKWITEFYRGNQI